MDWEVFEEIPNTKPAAQVLRHRVEAPIKNRLDNSSFNSTLNYF